MKTKHLMWSVVVVLWGSGCEDVAKDGDETDVPVETDVDPTDDTDDTDPDAPACWVEGTPGQCWDCGPPEAPESDSLKVLNQCSTTSFYVFDNATRISASVWSPGNPLPVVP